MKLHNERAAMEGLPYAQAHALQSQSDQPQWLIEGLWGEQAVGILGGQPKCCKSFMALDIAVSVASATPCLRRFGVGRSGPVLMFPAEDALDVVRQRLVGICAAAKVPFEQLAVYVITSPRLLLDVAEDRQRLRQTIQKVRPVLLILDPLIRMHSADENVSKDIAPILGYLRQLQREFHMAVLLVHHARKRSGQERPGQLLRGSSDLHGWGDSNLYLRRNGKELVLSIEHRAAPSGDDIPLSLVAQEGALALSIQGPIQRLPPQPPSPPPLADRVIAAMEEAEAPLSTSQLRKRCRIRTQSLCNTLGQLRDQGRIIRTEAGYEISRDDPVHFVSFPGTPLGAAGNGNGKQHQLNLPL